MTKSRWYVAVVLVTVSCLLTPAMAAKVKSMVDAKVAEGGLRSRDGVNLVDFYEACLGSYTYLRHPDPS